MTTTNQHLLERLDRLQATHDRLMAQFETLKALLREGLQWQYTTPSGLQLYTELADSLRDAGVDVPEYFELPPHTSNLIETKSFLLEELLVQLSNLNDQLDAIKHNAEYKDDDITAGLADTSKAIVLDDIMPLLCGLGVKPCAPTRK